MGYFESDKDDIELSGIFVKETELAYCIDFGDSNKWVPKSISDINPTDPEKGDAISICLPEWFATKEELI